MITKKTWKEFRATGLLLFVNQLLHLFGWALVFEFDENKEISDVYPARCKFRGFSDDVQEQGYKDVSQYLKENIDELQKEANS